MLSRLRKIESLTIKIAEEMPIQFDFETDTLYLRGHEEERRKNVLSLLRNGIEPSMIVNLLDLPIEEVERIIAEFHKGKAIQGGKK